MNKSLRLLGGGKSMRADFEGDSFRLNYSFQSSRLGAALLDGINDDDVDAYHTKEIIQ